MNVEDLNKKWEALCDELEDLLKTERDEVRCGAIRRIVRDSFEIGQAVMLVKMRAR